MFDVILSPEARSFYTESDPTLARKLDRCFAQLEHDPRRHNNVKRLIGDFAGLLRYRIGDWRVVYEIDDTNQRVSVLIIAHRREIYD